LKDLIHQCGHIIFSALTFEKHEYFNIHPDTALREFNHRDNDGRSIYVAFHGIFTEAYMNECLNLCIEKIIFSKKQEHELKGRLTFILNRFKDDIQSLQNRTIFSEKGLYVYDKIRQIFDDIYKKRQDLIHRFDFSNQSYNFSYDRFVEINPLL
jgi:hypothetical protein